MALHELGHELLPIEDVRDLILGALAPLPTELRQLAACTGAVLREEVKVREPVPPFDSSAMDGFAVRSQDLASASESAPVKLPVARGLFAGDPVGGRLLPGAAVKIMTGAPVPEGADAVVPHELTRFTEHEVLFQRPVRAGQNLRRAGGDLRPGDAPLPVGTVLGGPQLALLATMGRSRVSVTRTPRVAILSPGNELVEVERVPGPGQIRNSNAYALLGLLVGAGVEPVQLGIVRDSREAVVRAIELALEVGADAIVSTGGVSAGDLDFVQAVVRERGRPGHVLKVAMRPGKPQVFGLFEGRPLLGLPGNPAAAILSFEIFVRPALRRLRGEREVLPVPFLVRFPFEHRYPTGRTFLLRTRVVPDLTRGGFQVALPGAQDSSFLSSLADANALVLLPPEGGVVEVGGLRPAIWLGGR